MKKGKGRKRRYKQTTLCEVRQCIATPVMQHHNTSNTILRPHGKLFMPVVEWSRHEFQLFIYLLFVEDGIFWQLIMLSTFFLPRQELINVHKNKQKRSGDLSQSKTQLCQVKAACQTSEPSGSPTDCVRVNHSTSKYPHCR